MEALFALQEVVVTSQEELEIYKGADVRIFVSFGKPARPAIIDGGYLHPIIIMEGFYAWAIGAEVIANPFSEVVGYNGAILRLCNHSIGKTRTRDCTLYAPKGNATYSCVCGTKLFLS